MGFVGSRLLRIDVYIHMYIRTYVHTYIHTYTYIYIYMHAYVWLCRLGQAVGFFWFRVQAYIPKP